MWVFMNDAFFSIVEDYQVPEQFVIRARIKGDLENAFGVAPSEVIVDAGTDYKFRIYADREFVAKTMQNHVMEIDYDNFKDSISFKDKERKLYYSKVWAVMNTWQEKLYGVRDWWTQYRQR